MGRGIPLPIGRGAGGGGLSGIIILVVIFFALRACGIDPLQLLEGGPTNPQLTESGSKPGDEEGQFVSVVLAETEDVWNGIFQAEGRTYTEPTLVLFSDQVRSACGFASSASGPFYCPGDSKLYIDLTFFRELSQRFGASGDFAQAYVVAHEVGHHIQNLTGILPRFNQMRQTMSQVEANQMSIRVELQADCFAGIWAHYTAQKGLLEEGDIEEALNAPTRSATTRCRSARRAMSCPTASTTAPPTSARHGSPMACATEGWRIATRLTIRFDFAHGPHRRLTAAGPVYSLSRACGVVGGARHEARCPVGLAACGRRVRSLAAPPPLSLLPGEKVARGAG
jgi:predicted metalloprotease